jgi:hypothetical protein
VSETSFDYSNLSGRPITPLVSVAGRFSRGVREVQQQVAPYARAWQDGNRRALAADGPLWVAIGDSMTQGIGATAYDRGWVGQLAAQLSGRYAGVRIVNLSFNGARVADVLDRQLPALEELVRRHDVRPDLVTVMIGSNDLVNRRHRPLLPDVAGEMLARLVRHDSTPRPRAGRLPRPPDAELARQGRRGPLPPQRPGLRRHGRDHGRGAPELTHPWGPGAQWRTCP